MIELGLLQQQLGKKGKLITQDTVDELNRLAEDPDYSDVFLDQYISYFNILEKDGVWTTPKYMNAMKFFTLVEADHSLVDAYVKVFPERLEARLDRGEKKRDMGGEASRYNASQLVNEIRKVATAPVQLVHRNLLHKAIMKSAQLMNDPGVSPAVQQKAAEVLIRELKPAETNKISIEVTNDKDAIGELRRATEELAMAQMRMIQGGSSPKEIAESRIIEVELVDE